MKTRPCVYEKWERRKDDHRYEYVPGYVGKFHRWAAKYEEFQSGPGNYTVALIEATDGSIDEVEPSKVKFTDVEARCPSR